jgi:hypothetical protein
MLSNQLEQLKAYIKNNTPEQATLFIIYKSSASLNNHYGNFIKEVKWRNDNEKILIEHIKALISLSFKVTDFFPSEAILKECNEYFVNKLHLENKKELRKSFCQRLSCNFSKNQLLLLSAFATVLLFMPRLQNLWVIGGSGNLPS